MTRGTAREVLLASAANFAALGALTAPAIALIPARIAEFTGRDDRAGTLAVVVALGAAVAVVANPLFGWLSDRTRSRWGRRAPWILGGAVAGALGVWLVTQADGVVPMAAGWALAQLGYNATLAAVAAQFADALTEQARAKASGFFAASTFLGALPPLVLVAVFPEALTAASIGIALAAFVPVVACAAWARRGRPEPATRNEDVGTRPHRWAFAALWVQRLLMLGAFGLMTEFSLYLVMDRMRLPADAATPVVALATLTGGAALVAASVLAGIAASRRGAYLRFLVFAAAGLAGAAGLRAITSDVPVLLIAAAVGGIAMGVFFAVDLALALRIIPQGQAGRYLGMLNVTETVPQVAAPLAAAALLRVGGADPVAGTPDNFVSLLLVAATLAVAAGGMLFLLRGFADRPAPESASALGDAAARGE